MTCSDTSPKDGKLPSGVDIDIAAMCHVSVLPGILMSVPIVRAYRYMHDTVASMTYNLQAEQ